MAQKLIWGFFFLIIGVLVSYFSLVAQPQQGGDIAEYYGITESVINHQGFDLTDQDQKQLSQMLHQSYFADPTYYVAGRDGRRYPVHFIFYSLSVVPFRLLAQIVGINELRSLWLANIAWFAGMMALIFITFVKSWFQRLVFLGVVLASPLTSFFAWPGPDLFYLSLLLLAGWAAAKHRYGWAVISVAVASWQSQPLGILAVGLLGIYFFSNLKVFAREKEAYIGIPWRVIGMCLGVVGLLSLPYLYNFWAFGTWTPWTLFAEGWTQSRGFGLHNASFQKLFEQFFDPNVGLAWYAPGWLLLGLIVWVMRAKKDERSGWLGLLVLITAVFYQTNPAWHYGTAGFGPGRHGVFVLPFLLVLVANWVNKQVVPLLLLGAVIISQGYLLSLNNWLEPNLTDSLRHSPQAQWVLDTVPDWYWPTPEIFVDRTNHLDLKQASSAVYQDDSQCVKAYLVDPETELVGLEQTCGSVGKLRPVKSGGAYVEF